MKSGQEYFHMEGRYFDFDTAPTSEAVDGI
jgi:hypothetical protein